ncbi:CNNM domain-containing protein [Streptomyces sp. NPDC007929]|uniref:CNNM domain-containing protein n=1 Tax=unclassified Streptomyces TaxID=2593676 RepID=UPI0036E97776
MLIAVLIVFNALFAGSEVALISLRESQVRRLNRGEGASATRLVRLVQEPNRFLATIQIGITLAGFLASATAAVSLAEPLVPVLSFAGQAARPLAVASVTLTLTFVTLVAGELAPKRLAMQYAERWALLAAPPLDILATMARPAVWTLSQATNLIVRLFGGDPRQGQRAPSREELRDIVVSHRGLTVEQRTIISSALEIHDHPLRAILVPRGSVFTLSDGMPAEQARLALARSGHSRAPVLRAGHIDDVLGVVHLRDLPLADDASSVAEAARPSLAGRTWTSAPSAPCPDALDTESAQAAYDNGVLTLHIAPAAHTKPGKIALSLGARKRHDQTPIRLLTATRLSERSLNTTRTSDSM